MARILAFGELLWDLFPDRRRLGGAPANAAFHLAQAGHDSRLASCVGEDADGEGARAELSKAGLDTRFVGVDPRRPTGSVKVALNATGSPRFEIRRDVAWDRIPCPPELIAWLGDARALIYGTLAQRETANRETLRALIAAAPGALKILDLNFRPPFVDAELTRSALREADILKLSGEELEALPDLLAMAGSGDFAGKLLARFGLKRIYVTLGAEGCELIGEDERLRVAAPPVEVADTVGAGDAFTAALVDGELRGLSGRDIAARACALGAFVASQPGAMPPWTAEIRARLSV